MITERGLGLNRGVVVPRVGHEFRLLDGVYLLPWQGVGRILYAPAMAKVALISEAQAALLEANALQEVEIVRLVSSLLGGSRLETIQGPEVIKDYAPIKATLMLTSACQLRCHYCYANAGSTKVTHLDEQIGAAAIDFVVSNARKLGTGKFAVHFHAAGEPTLRRITILNCLEYARARACEHALELETELTTNLCIPEDEAVHYAQNLGALHVSCDGPPRIMRLNRPAVRSGGDSGEIVESAILAIMRSGQGKKLTIRATVTQSNLYALVECVEYFASLGIKRLSFAPASSSGRGGELGALSTSEYIRSWLEANRAAEKLGVRLDHPNVHLGEVRTSGFACGIGGGNFVVLPNGSISVCHEAVVPDVRTTRLFEVGEFSAEGAAVNLDYKRIASVRKDFHVDRRKVCSACFCRFTCAGGCAAHAVNDGCEPRDAPMGQFCDIVRTLTYERICGLLPKGE